jgi:hypothetical protein
MTKYVIAAFTLLAVPALAQTNLSRPGAIDRLKSDKPAHFEAVMEIAAVGQTLTCSDEELGRLKARFIAIAKVDCGFVDNGSTPPSRRMRFEIEDASYVMTVRLSDTAPKLMGRDK